MCKKCRDRKICFNDFYAQERQYIKNNVEKKDRTYICSACGAKYRVTKTKILTEFAVRFFAVVGVLEILSELEHVDLSTVVGMKQNFFVDKLLEIAMFVILCIICFPLILRLNSFVHWIFSRPIKWYSDTPAKIER